MAFSFSPGQIAPQGSQAVNQPGVVAPGTVASTTVGTPSDSPFLIIKERSEGRPISIMACVQVVLLLASILSIFICLVMYGYSVYLKNQVEKKQQLLLDTEAGLPDYPYDKMYRLSRRMIVLDNLLKNYISSRSPLKFLENVVENQVFFDNFSLAKDRKGSYAVTFAAKTYNYKSLIQQLEALKLTEYQKVAPTPKTGGIEGSDEIKVMVNTPIFVQGKLPDDVVFFVTQIKQSSSTPITTQVSTTTKTNNN
jgi:hypothetical protein